MCIRDSAYGIPGVIVDGMDFFAVYEAVSVAVGRARNGEGPTLLEAKTYRYFGHYEGDPMKYRLKNEEQTYRERDPIVTFKRRVLAENLLTSTTMADIEERMVAQVDAAVKSAEEALSPEAVECLNGVYVNYP